MLKVQHSNVWRVGSQMCGAGLSRNAELVDKLAIPHALGKHRLRSMLQRLNSFDPPSRALASSRCNVASRRMNYVQRTLKTSPIH